ncbi:MAG: 1-acyl-sn-glycerol-3-phosphate acyltransferase [Bacteroidales bacterium]|jgi:1-acyl-sn-glycerol-3-phosphate acyltransferase|nr:1-acyl-sn-glycerol-3-phosphate acyltransferase [Bacteroidales bacterium]
MIAPGRGKVIENIRDAVSRSDFNAKVETGDAVLGPEQVSSILHWYLRCRNRLSYKIPNFVSLLFANIITWYLNRDTEIVGLEKLSSVRDGAIVTCNHFNPFDNAVVRKMVAKIRKGGLYIVSEDANFVVPGFWGFMMKYANLIPISRDMEYMTMHFGKIIGEIVRRKRFILIYPEQEMWFNYRKPRSLKKGAYYYASMNGVPVVSCFIEIRDLPRMQAPDFHRNKCVIHVLDPIYPDPAKSDKVNAAVMCATDYRQKKDAYEKAYGKPLDYEFESWDIAGWSGITSVRE